MDSKLPDLKTESDIKKIVDAFYKKVINDGELGFYFSNTDWEKHLPLMINFWSALMFQNGKYFGYPFLKHESLKGLKEIHFKAWLEHFKETVDEHFAGEMAELAKEKAEQISTVFSIKLGIHRT